ncbi:methyl-accepting chemotaxis protein [Limnobacter humi]|uniref:Methyl-accepting chemotaxis protein n=1 Tax=Limnobacter humi TaxID=1778671 RepID=A0ABT1WFY0_9BURK|nr:PAS domain-containing methyl-accepting chemotaxis protein [Limnobacter humi]MCQ8895956.1 methyl-accepting chemotaxis protein [Limnobacter humi]
MSSTEQHPKGRVARMAVPTNNTERLLDAKVPIVTKTDLKGKITYANPAFVDISGFELNELLGQPHNVVRHPDMPGDAFKDLWETVRQGEPWKGLVKNRCKDGGFYWVDAYVTPLTQNGQRIGYMSVRSKPNEDQKRDAERLYQSVNAGSTPFPWTKTNQGRLFDLDLAMVCLLPVLFALMAAFNNPVLTVVGTVLGLITAVSGLFWLKSRIKNTTQALLDAMSALSEGNFKHEIPSSPVREFNQVHTAFKSMQVNLRAIIADVVSGSGQVSDNANDLRNLAVDLMSRSNQQSDGINSVAAALEELSVSVHEISEATNKSSNHAKNAMDVVETGSVSMQRSTQATGKVAEVVLDAKRNIEELNVAVQKISTVTRTITEIAEKTNLLALNAAIEAARAGESGRGFAVVADEVRKLAEMTRQSTTEIASTVQEVQTGTTRGLETMNRAVREVEVGTALIQEAGESLAAIKAASSGVAQSAKDISAMLEQQSTASLEVANSMERMSALTESNMAAIQDLDSAAGRLANTSGDLKTLVKHFEASL